MKKIINIALLSLLLFSAVGCYSKFENPEPAHIYTDADFEDAEIISIKDLKDNYSSLVEKSRSEQITENWVIRGKVISSDQEGNIYKSLYILDHDAEVAAAIELRLFASNYVNYPVGSMVYVRLKDLSIGDYKGMLSIGARSVDPEFTHTTLEGRLALSKHIFVGERLAMTSADTIVVNKSNYKDLLGDDALARLVRFEGVESTWGKAKWGYKNSYPNYFASANDNFEWSESLGENYPDLAVAPLAYYGPTPNGDSSVNVRYYGSSWYSYEPSGTNNEEGQYVIRLSAYARFSDTKIPVEGSKVNITAIYTQFGSGDTKSFQLTPSYGADIEVIE